jgi:2-phosphosulfolactate phosphatase
MKSLQVIYTPRQLAERSPDSFRTEICVVIDILRATSTIVTALAEGATALIPFASVEQARHRHRSQPTARLAGEQGGLPPAGFAFGNSPREMTSLQVRGHTLLHATTNGTRALAACASAKKVIVGSFLNFRAVLRDLTTSTDPITFICAGTGDDFSLEDALFAGALAQQWEPGHPIAALFRANENRVEQTLLGSRNGRHLVKIGLIDDVRWCAQWDRYNVLPCLKEGEIRI